eukprot:6918176-Prorocentrum_lima.AAC.1
MDIRSLETGRKHRVSSHRVKKYFPPLADVPGEESLNMDSLLNSGEQAEPPSIPTPGADDGTTTPSVIPPPLSELEKALAALHKAHKSKAKQASGLAKVSAVCSDYSQESCILAVDTQAQVSVISAQAIPGLQLAPSPWTQVQDFSGKTTLDVLGQVMIPILGIQTPFQVVEGYMGNALLGEPFISYPGVTITASQLRVTG